MTSVLVTSLVTLSMCCTAFLECSHCWLWNIFLSWDKFSAVIMLSKNLFGQMNLSILQWGLFQTNFFWINFHISYDNFVLDMTLLNFFQYQKVRWGWDYFSDTLVSFSYLFAQLWLLSFMLNSYFTILSQNFQNRII